MNDKHTIKELIKLLSGLSEDMSIELEGCDCFGEWSGRLYVSYEKDEVILGRDGGVYHGGDGYMDLEGYSTIGGEKEI